MSVESEMVPEGTVAVAHPVAARRVGGVVRVNLVPPEFQEARRLRSFQVAVAGAAVAVVAVAGALYVQQSHQVEDAKADLATAQADGTRLQAEQTRLGDVNALYAKVDAAKAMLASAQAPQVLWSRYLQDVRVQLPERTWLTGLNLTEAAAPAATTAAAPSATAGTTAASAAAAAPCGVIGSLGVSGSGYTHRDVADWLDRLAGLKAVTNPYLASSTEALVGKTLPTVTWSTTASLDCHALASAGGK